MDTKSLRKKFIDFFISKGHKKIPSASLIPEDDPTILFTPAGMSPLVRYLMGEPHPLGKRLCSVQKCVRTDDIEEVGDLTHFTFFEMLGNWSLGDYFKKQAIDWSFEFVTDKKWLNFDPNNIYVTVFEGDKDAPKDSKSIKIWQETFKQVGIEAKVGNREKPDLRNGERIFTYSKKENWWGPAGQTGPCGPDTEMFYDTGKIHNKKFGPYCHPNCDCGRFFEFWNNVFMQYNKLEDGKFIPLSQKNVDTGMGFERVVALTEYLAGKIKNPDPYLSYLFNSLIKEIEKTSNKDYENSKRQIRTIADHLRASIFIIAAGVIPANKDRGYVLRRLIRRTVDNLNSLGIKDKNIFIKAVNFFKKNYSSEYRELKNSDLIEDILLEEVEKYDKVLKINIRDKINVQDKSKEVAKDNKEISGKKAFQLFSTHGLSPEQLKQQGYKFSLKDFDKEIKKHQEISRQGMKQKFSGGLQDQSADVIKLHTATHLLHEALRRVLGEKVKQVGSNITKERLRFDFIHSKPLTKIEIEKVQEIVNKQIKNNHKVEFKIMTVKEALSKGALAFFGQRYPDKVKVYQIGNFSQEVCGGPHVDFTGALERFIIKKEESCGAGKRRIYAVVKNGT
ncbi:alanine--tRNA ligase [Patescibacteria group bacterium]